MKDSLINIRDALTVLSDLWYDVEDGDNAKKKEHDELYTALDEELKKNGFPLGMETPGTYEDVAKAVSDMISYLEATKGDN